MLLVCATGMQLWDVVRQQPVAQVVSTAVADSDETCMHGHCHSQGLCRVQLEMAHHSVCDKLQACLKLGVHTIACYGSLRWRHHTCTAPVVGAHTAGGQGAEQAKNAKLGI